MTIEITVTPIVLCCMAEKGVISRKHTTRCVFEMCKKMKGSGISCNAIYRGHINHPEKGIVSDTVDAEIYYWLSNGFIKEFGKYPDDRWYSVEKPMFVKSHKLCNIHNELPEFGDDVGQRSFFIEMLEEVIESM